MLDIAVVIFWMDSSSMFCQSCAERFIQTLAKETVAMYCKWDWSRRSFLCTECNDSWSCSKILLWRTNLPVKITAAQSVCLLYSLPQHHTLLAQEASCIWSKEKEKKTNNLGWQCTDSRITMVTPLWITEDVFCITTQDGWSVCFTNLSKPGIL